ncbi:MAG: potassium channel protein, partial [Merismopedia sp. SIO2A8]|nr:potassium channel protein [Merismopedia sp. SIO2A8]
TIEQEWSLWDSLYMTVITLSTVGFSEVHPLDDNGRKFTILLIFLGIASIGYIGNRITEAVFQGHFQERLRLRQQQQAMNELSGHYIICGLGRTGLQIAYEFAAERTDFVAIDCSEDAITNAQEHVISPESHRFVPLIGDATLDETLVKARIEKAQCIVAALPSDAENLYIVLSAKTLNKEIRAIARANSEEAFKKLQRGGADAVVSPYITGGKRMAAAALRPQVIDFVDGILAGTERSFYMEEFLIDPNTCTCVGQTLREARLRSRSGALVLAIRRADGSLIVGPTADTRLQIKDMLICMGTTDQLRRLNQILSPLRTNLLRLPKRKTGTET